MFKVKLYNVILKHKLVIQVGYEAGSNGERLPPLYMRSLDDELVPVIHQAASQSGEGKTVVELVFSVMRH